MVSYCLPQYTKLSVFLALLCAKLNFVWTISVMLIKIFTLFFMSIEGEKIFYCNTLIIISNFKGYYDLHELYWHFYFNYFIFNLYSIYVKIYIMNNTCCTPNVKCQQESTLYERFRCSQLNLIYHVHSIDLSNLSDLKVSTI